MYNRDNYSATEWSINDCRMCVWLISRTIIRPT